MKRITNVKDIKKNYAINDNRTIVGEMDDVSLTIGLNGEEQIVPILGLFKANDKYYVTLLVQENNKEVVVIYEVVNKDGVEHIQIIESVEEWKVVEKVWADIMDAAETKL